MSKQDRRKFTPADHKKLRQKYEFWEGSGPRAQQRVLVRMRAAKEKMRNATSGLKRARLRKELGLELD